MICARPDCPIEFRAQAMNAYIKREQEECGFTFNAHMEHTAQCKMCNAPVSWTREADGELRLKSGAARP